MAQLTWGGDDAGGGSGVRDIVLAGCWAAVAALVLLALRMHRGDVVEAVAAAVLALAAIGTALLWPALDGAAATRPMAPLVALIGCDGSGKSTLSADLADALAGERAVRTCYLGLGSGVLGERIRALPLIGARMERRLAAKAARTRTRGETIPGLGTALVVYAFSLARVRRFRRMLALRRAGVVVITDRYPQVEVPGFYDGPGLSAAASGSWAVAALARAERRLYRWMAGVRPDVVIRLNVDLATATARRPADQIDLLRRKVAVTPTLRFGGARIVDVDSTRAYDAVRAQVRGVVNDTLAARAA